MLCIAKYYLYCLAYCVWLESLTDSFGEERRQRLRDASGGRGVNFVRLLDTPEGAQAVGPWIVRSGRLMQFQVARALIVRITLTASTLYQ
jgi:hypothetical protein